MRLRDRPPARLDLAGKELVEGLPAAGSLDVVVDVVVRRLGERLDSCGRRRRVEERAPGLDEAFHPDVEFLVPVQCVAGRLVDDVVELEALGHDFPFCRDERNKVIQVIDEAIHVPDVLEIRSINCGIDRTPEVRTCVHQAQEIGHDGCVSIAGVSLWCCNHEKDRKYCRVHRPHQALSRIPTHVRLLG